MSNQGIMQVFFDECDEQLSELESNLLALEGGEHNLEAINAVFRAVHSIKGGAGAFGMEELVRFAHTFETILDQVREGDLTPDATVLKAMLKASDVLTDLVRCARDGENVAVADVEIVMEQLNALNGTEAEKEIDESDDDFEIEFQPVPVCLDDIDCTDAGEFARFEISFRPRPMLYENGNDAVYLLRELRSLGEIEVQCDADALPTLDEIEPEGAFLTWQVTLHTNSDESKVREIFEFVQWDCDLSISAGNSLACGEAGIPDKVEAHLCNPAVGPADPGQFDAGSEHAETINSEAAVAPEKPSKSANIQATIRVNLERVEQLINLVGELVINQAMLEQQAEVAGLDRTSAICSGLNDLQKLTKEIQDGVMAIRAQPVKPVFQRMHRIAREAGEATAKIIRLVTEGETTEVDKTVIERLTDPLTHMLRNAIDHGLESPEARVRAGKPEEGTICLSANHRSGRVVIEIADDGAGIDREKVRSIAVARGLIEADTALEAEDIDNLIFRPGFSTAEQVSDLSGRGVGLDVVRRAVEKLGGRVSIASQPGIGTKITMSLPLTLAVQEGMLVDVADHTLVVPLAAILESLKPRSDMVNEIGLGKRLIKLQDSFVPLVDVAETLGFRKAGIDPTQGVALLVETPGGTRCVLLVDAIQGQNQVVIKSVERHFSRVPGIAAATILGDGRVALIADTEDLVAHHQSVPERIEPKLTAMG